MNGYQEHLDFENGRSFNEAYSAYQLSRAEANVHLDDAKIEAALAAGKVVLIDGYSVYCRFTDAMIGYCRELVAVFDSPEDAKDAVVFGSDGEGRFLLYPIPAFPSSYPPLDDADIPF